MDPELSPSGKVNNELQFENSRLIASLDKEEGLRRVPGLSTLSYAYGIPHIKRVMLSFISKWEGGQYYSYTMRRILLEQHGVYGGAYSYGEWTRPGCMPPGLKVGRYVSMAAGVRVLSRNHPYDRLSMHPFFYNSKFGYVQKDSIEAVQCWIGHDAWIGASVIVTPGCSRIGVGAVVGAGAVVTKNVPDFAIVAGNPAKILKFRFSEDAQKRALESRWWELPSSGLTPYIADLSVALESMATNHPLFRV